MLENLYEGLNAQKCNGRSNQKVQKTKSIYFWILLLGGPSSPTKMYMGQFLQDGENVRFMSLFFKKWMARAAKPSDIDDFFWFAVTYHDFGMPLK